MTPSTTGVRLTQVLLMVVTVAVEVHFHVIEHAVVLPPMGTDTQRLWWLQGFLTAHGLGALVRRSL